MQPSSHIKKPKVHYSYPYKDISPNTIYREIIVRLISSALQRKPTSLAMERSERPGQILVDEFTLTKSYRAKYQSWSRVWLSKIAGGCYKYCKPFDTFQTPPAATVVNIFHPTPATKRYKTRARREKTRHQLKMEFFLMQKLANNKKCSRRLKQQRPDLAPPVLQTNSYCNVFFSRPSMRVQTFHKPIDIYIF